MIKEGKFGVQEGIALVLLTNIAKAFYTNPTNVIQFTGTAGWYVIFISILIAAALFTPVYLTLKMYPGKNIMEAYDIAMGKFFGSIFSLFIFAFLFYQTVINLSQSAGVLIIYNFQVAPMWIIMSMAMVGMIVVSFLGIESLARVSKFFIYVIVGAVALLLILGVQNYNIKRLYPIHGYGLRKSLYFAFIRASTYREVFIAAVFANCFQGIHHFKKAAYIGLLLSGVIISWIILSITLTFPYNVAQELVSPIYELASLIEYGRFFQRLESTFLVSWNLCNLISLGGTFYASIVIYCHIFKINDKKAVIIPFSIITFTLSLLPGSFLTSVITLQKAYVDYGWPFILLAPIIPYATARLRKKGGKANA